MELKPKPTSSAFRKVLDYAFGHKEGSEEGRPKVFLAAAAGNETDRQKT